MNKTDTKHFIALCPEESKASLVKELSDLSTINIKTSYRCVHFEANKNLSYECHLKLRTASSILEVIKSFTFTNLSAFSSRIYKIKWHEIFSYNTRFNVESIVTKKNDPNLKSSHLSSRFIKALEARVKKETNSNPPYSKKDPQLTFVIYLDQKKIFISVKTSGKSLHKRGYRLPGHNAPIKETLAASILQFMDYRGQTTLFDPMCGSGTIAIEAAYIALNKASQIHRKQSDFSLPLLKDFDHKIFKEVQDKIRGEKLSQLEHPIYASDIDKEHTNLAQKNALRARVEKFIDFKQQDFFKTDPPCENGYLVANLPYGQRLHKNQSLDDLYSQVGRHLKHKYMGWKAGLFVKKDTNWKKIGFKPQKKILLKNGSIYTLLLIFDIYKGKRT